MKIYTRKGDDGRTQLASGERVWKHSRRVDLYGEVDELNSALGMAGAALPPSAEELALGLKELQRLLFELGSELAGFRATEDGAVFPDDILALEQSIDRMSAALPPMRHFVLPGGGAAAAALHLARTFCRRLERSMTRLIAEGNQDEQRRKVVSDTNLRFINRLSDYLFTAARFANHLEGIEDVQWRSRARSRQGDEKETPPLPPATS
ncbi:MAG: cob(I)yrinic acid a,c-diamide adenosyltransferase [Leptospirales bacterium]|nr:cob(I)yrinic acid a,c-diamide adenosyltransferase [Leptospirales bacterium]